MPTDFVSLVIYNQSTVASIFTVRVYDGNGALVGQASTPAIPGLLASYSEGGTYGIFYRSCYDTVAVGRFQDPVDGGANFPLSR